MQWLMLWDAAGMPGPNFPMSNPFWPQMGSGMPGGNQGPRPPLYPGAGNNGQFDPVSAAYYASLGNQQMAAAMAAAAVRLVSLPAQLHHTIRSFPALRNPLLGSVLGNRLLCGFLLRAVGLTECV